VYSGVSCDPTTALILAGYLLISFDSNEQVEMEVDEPASMERKGTRGHTDFMRRSGLQGILGRSSSSSIRLCSTCLAIE
jgi:hypothetical protein